MAFYSDVIGTSLGRFLVGIGGVLLKNTGGNLILRDAADNSDAQLTASQINISGATLILNSDAAGVGSDRRLTLSQSNTQAEDIAFIFPAGQGAIGESLCSKGNGETEWKAPDPSYALRMFYGG